jgi:rubrerythrin
VSRGTRRDALRGAALAAGAVATPALLRPAAAQAQAEDDESELRDFLTEAIALEQIAALAYETVADADRVSAELARTLRTFAEQEQAHATALRTALDSIGFDPPDAPSGPRDSQAITGIDRLDPQRAEELVELLEGLADLEGDDRSLEHMVALETEQIDLYVGVTPDFVSEDLLRTGAEIAGCQAQHVVVLREALGEPPARAVPELPSDEGD